MIAAGGVTTYEVAFRRELPPRKIGGFSPVSPVSFIRAIIDHSSCRGRASCTMQLAANDTSRYRRGETKRSYCVCVRGWKTSSYKVKRRHKFRRIDNHRRSRIIEYNLRGAGVKRVIPGNFDFERGRKGERWNYASLCEKVARLSRAFTNRWWADRGAFYRQSCFRMRA